MIIQCEKCKTKFNLDGALLNEGGSKVRCSLCKHVFVAHPETQIPLEQAETVAVDREELESGLARELPPEPENDAYPGEEGTFEAVSLEDLNDLVEDEGHEQGRTSDASLTEDEEEEPVEEEPEDEVKTSSAVSGRSGSRLLLIMLIILLVLIGGAVAIFFWAPGLIPDSLSFLKPPEKQVIADIGVRRLMFKDVTGTFLNSEKEGQLFVIRGKVENRYPKSRSFILVKGNILDDKGKEVKKQLAYAGNALAEAQIKTMAMEDILKSMKNRQGKSGSNLNVAPDTSVHFMIVFDDLPENLSEFTVEAVSSSPGV